MSAFTPRQRDRAREWLKTNPPPKTFKGTRMQWAELNMPAVPAWVDRLLARFGVKLAALMVVGALAAPDAQAGDWQTVVDTTRADKWTGLDKRMHFGAGALVSAGALALQRSPHEAFAIGVGVAAAKEYFDLRNLQRHSPSGKDFAVTVVGAAVGAYVPGLVLGPRYIGFTRKF